MNIVSVMVGMTLMASATPVVLDMSLAPIVAQKRAQNFGAAETQAVTFAAQHEGKVNIPENNEYCAVRDIGNLSYEVTCEQGKGKFKQKVTRAFRLRPEYDDGTTYTNPERVFAFETPKDYSHVECLATDPWGVIWYNDHLKAGNLKACIPSPLWSSNRYYESNPNDWLYDISGYGYGIHPDY